MGTKTHRSLDFLDFLVQGKHKLFLNLPHIFLKGSHKWHGVNNGGEGVNFSNAVIK